MKLEKQLASLELAKKLKELGVKQESLFYWNGDAKEELLNTNADGTFQVKRMNYYDLEWRISQCKSHHPATQANISAFTVAELGEMLPREVNIPYKNGKPRRSGHRRIFGQYGVENQPWVVRYWFSSQTENPEVRADTEADARAKMLIYLIENELVDMNGIRNVEAA